MPEYLERTLKSAGFDVEPTLNLWQERGWLKTDGPERRGLRVMMAGKRPRVVAVTKAAVDEALGG